MRNRNSSPSLQNTSHTRHARSNGSDLLYRVKILEEEATVSDCFLIRYTNHAGTEPVGSMLSLQWFSVGKQEVLLVNSIKQL